MTMYEIDDRANSPRSRPRQGGCRRCARSRWLEAQQDEQHAGVQRTRQAGVEWVWSSPSFTYTHEKTVIIDDATAWIMTMNLDTTSRRTTASTSRSTRTPRTSLKRGDLRGRLRDDVNHADRRPRRRDSNARADSVALIGTATKTLDVEVEEFSDVVPDGVVDAVVRPRRRGVTVRIVVANESPSRRIRRRDQPSRQQPAQHRRQRPDVGTAQREPVHPRQGDPGRCSTERARARFVGSENFSTSSLDYNRELGVMFDDSRSSPRSRPRSTQTSQRAPSSSHARSQPRCQTHGLPIAGT